MDTASTTRAFQGVLDQHRFSGAVQFPEKFAQTRFHKKYQTPDRNLTKKLQAKAWDDWSAYDLNLAQVTTRDFFRFPVLYKARAILHKELGRVELGRTELPKGSEFTPTFGCNSIESRLCRSEWTVTHDCFELFARTVYEHTSLKRAFRQRYYKWYQTQKFDVPLQFADKRIYSRMVGLHGQPKASYEAFLWKLSRVVTFTHGSRFSSVPKNNEMRRPINIEPFGNIVVQRRVGNFLREALRKGRAIDLDTLAETHRRKICDPGVATIDLKNASDSISLALCEFLLPKSLYALLLSTRSACILSPTKDYVPIVKISSMGNGFTFELMTFILTVLAQLFDEGASVFGDDIIISNDAAPDLIKLLEGVGFQVNEEKSFISSPFRESCGGNFHDEF